ncbi:unnamed protein product [Meganyctiphanes norvegica]|uniref:NAD(P)-binding domain-containing protein n=1 Tax=Meganyctiphanes norvegica TaxID=48144 RepID=A0AAV2RWK2_MEGNR
MKIAVLGATGPTGLQAVRVALEQGHEVSAVVRNPSKITQQHDNLKVIEANLFDEASVTKALEGQEAVVSCLGFNRNPQPVTGYTNSAKTFLPAMRKNNISRIVLMTAWYTDLKSGSRGGFLVNWLLVPFLKPVLTNMREMEVLLEETAQDINYTVVRPPGLTNNPPSGTPVKTQEDFVVDNESGRVSRADVADFMISCLKTNIYDRKMVAMTL